MSLCSISYNYEHYAGIDVEKLSNIIYEYVKKEFADFNPQVSEPVSDMEMPDHVDMLLCKKDGSIFYESDILRRAVNIPHDCQMDGLVLEIFIQNCDGTRYKKDMHIPSLGGTRKLTASRAWENWKFIKLSAKGILTIKKAKTLKASEYLNLDLRFSSFINS